MKYVYLLVNGSDWEDMIIFLTPDEAINASIEYPNSRVEIFSKTDIGYKPTYNFYRNGRVYYSLNI